MFIYGRMSAVVFTRKSKYKKNCKIHLYANCSWPASFSYKVIDHSEEGQRVKTTAKSTCMRTVHRLLYSVRKSVDDFEEGGRVKCWS